MIDALLVAMNRVLPLLIREVSWNGDALVLNGDSWSFSTPSAWRLVADAAVAIGCWDKDVIRDLDTLRGISIVAVKSQGTSIEVDPTFVLSDGRMLEIFSTDTVEPWTMSFSDGLVYIGGS